jgi:hypothetical protein
MKPDPYIKVILTLIAAGILLNLLRLPPPAAQAQLSGAPRFEFLRPFGTQAFLDTRTGDIWFYDLTHESGRVQGRVRIEELGLPLNMNPK